jgi:hypothetical protein
VLDPVEVGEDELGEDGLEVFQLSVTLLEFKTGEVLSTSPVLASPKFIGSSSSHPLPPSGGGDDYHHCYQVFY